MPRREKIFMKEATGPCEVHEWSVEKLRSDLLPSMRARHGKGGLNACSDCLVRLRNHIRERLSNAP